MAPKVDENLVQQVMEFTNVSREDAKTAIRVPILRRALTKKSSDYDLERAVEYIMSGDLENEKQRGSRGILSQFKHYTRSKSPLKAKKSAPSEVINVSEDDNEDEQLRLALEMSLQDSSPSRMRTPNPSESRSADKSPYFGPARESEHHEGSWGMVLAGSGDQETGVVGDVSNGWSMVGSYTAESELLPAERKRVDGQPVVLDTHASTEWASDPVLRLGGLMTILHHIRRARDVFLLASPRESSMEEPGEGWWNGSQELATSNDETIDGTGESVLREAARIMAFLDGSIRSYGKITEYLVKALQKDLFKVPQRGPSTEAEISPSLFLQRWTQITQSIHQRTFLTSPLPIFNSEVFQPPSENQSVDYQSTTTELYIPVNTNRSEDGKSTIIDALEDTVWWGQHNACFTSFAEILLVHLKREDYRAGAGVEILLSLNMARFASQHYDKAEQDIRFRRVLKETLEKLNKKEEELTWIEKDGKRFNVIQILESTIQYVEEKEGGKMVDEPLNDEEDVDNRMDIDSDKKLPPLSTALKASLTTLKDKIQGNFSLKTKLEIQLNVQNMQQKMATIFDFPKSIVPPTTEDDENPSRIVFSYNLRGVVIDQHLTFFSEWEHYTNPYKRQLKWYKSDFSGKPEIVTVDVGEVLTMARERGSQGVLTVYVRDDIVEPVETVLPPEYLREFIQKDNEVFERELNPPVILVTEDKMDEVVDTESPSPPASNSKSLNPFLNREEFAEETNEDVSEEVKEDFGAMEVDKLIDVETNPFRRLSGETVASGWKVEETQ